MSSVHKKKKSTKTSEDLSPAKLYFHFQLSSHHLFLFQQHLFRPQSFLEFHSDTIRGEAWGGGDLKSQGHGNGRACGSPHGQNLGLGDLDLSDAGWVTSSRVRAVVEVASPPAMTSPGSGRASRSCREPICTILEFFVFTNTLQFAVHTLSTCGLSFAFANN